MELARFHLDHFSLSHRPTEVSPHAALVSPLGRRTVSQNNQSAFTLAHIPVWEVQFPVQCWRQTQGNTIHLSSFVEYWSFILIMFETLNK